MPQPILDRINTSDTGYVDGTQATIRDTGITVSRVVSELIRGRSTADLIAEHKNLDADDIHQTLLYALRDCRYTIWNYKSDGISPLAIIRNATELLRSHDLAREEQQELLNVIIEQCEKASDQWDDLSKWVNKTYDAKVTLP